MDLNGMANTSPKQNFLLQWLSFSFSVFSLLNQLFSQTSDIHGCVQTVTPRDGDSLKKKSEENNPFHLTKKSISDLDQTRHYLDCFSYSLMGARIDGWGNKSINPA